MKPLSLLPQLSYSVMLALSLRPRHGYEIIKQITEDSLGNINVGTGALYGTLKRLEQDTYIELIPGFDDHDRRHYYRLTKKGWDRLSAEAPYYQNQSQLIRDRHLLPNEGLATI